jgi:hypothetical protein
MKLYQVPLEFELLEQELIETEGELTPELEARFDAFMRGGKEKIEAAAMVVRRIETEADACDAQAKAILNGEVARLVTRKLAHEKNASRLKSMVLRAVDHAFSGKVKTPLFTIWGQTSAPSVSIDLAPGVTLEELEKESPFFVRKRLELDKNAVKAAEKSGAELPNSIIVSEVPGTRYLRIK